MKRTIVLAVLVLGLVLTAAGLVRLWPTSPTPPASSLTFVVLGDTEGHADVFERALTAARDHGAAFLILLGDLTARGTSEQFQAMAEVIARSPIHVMAVIGSHDIRQPTSRADFTATINDPNLAFDRDGYRFLLLDNADRKVGFSDVTLARLADDFRAHPNARYVLAYHRPFGLPFAEIVGDDETPTSRTSNQKFLELLANAQVTAIFSGHLHLYLPYTLAGIPAYVSGGGGGEQQTPLGTLGTAGHHALLVKLEGGRPHVEVLRLD